MLKRILSCLLTCYAFLPLYVQADDTEIYTGIAQRDAPNVIFIMDTSGSMGWANDGSRYPPPGESRLEQVQQAAVDTIKSVDGINIALMRFNEDYSGYGGYVDLAMTPVADARADFETTINSYNAWGGTPITEVMSEALRYLRGDSVRFGKYSSSYYGDAAARSGSSYQSPVSHQCQKNHIVLFSDGEPTSDTSSNNNAENWLKSIPSDERAGGLSINCGDGGSGACAEELAYWGNRYDHSSTLDGIQNVIFHTVGGFVQGAAQTKLENIAKYGSWAAPGKQQNPDVKEGEGIYANAQDYAALKKALKDIFDDIAKTSSTFTAPAVSVNAFNNLEHLDQLYYSVFKPTDSVGWSGNLKRYRLTGKGQVVDMNGDAAVDPDTGFFTETAHSFWTQNDADGNEVKHGGAASRLTNNRKVATYLGSNKNLLTSANLVHEGNNALTGSLLQTPATYDSDDIKKLIRWARGLDVDDEDADTSRDDARAFMEDPLHSQPVVITYGKDAATKTFDSSIYLATNSGFLHAFHTDKDNPEEHFAYIPKELLDNIYPYYSGLSALDKVYGLDGPISYWHNDLNRNGVILSGSSIEPGEHIYLYAGMRRGGRGYYALDVSDRENPKYLWQINGGSGDYAKLGQTWSKMIPATVKFKGVKTKVLFFGGGYDPAEDNYSSRTNHSMGNAIYMADAASGKLLWWASNSGSNLNMSAMRSSIVADIVAIDSNQDGYTNLLYTADVGGRVWRIDLDNGSSTAGTFAQGGVIADVNKGSVSGNIRFFNTPDVAYTKYGGFSPQGQFQISIGSGYRAHPLDTRVKDRFYIINDTDVYSIPAVYKNIAENDMANGDNFVSASNVQKENGTYYILSGYGEKVLAPSVTVADNILFTSYRPEDATSSSNCDADTGNTRLYQVTPIVPSGSSDDGDRTLEVTELAQGGIPPNPVVLFPPSDSGSDGDGDGDNQCPPGEDCGCPPGENCDPPDDSCEELKAITAIGAETVGNSITRCDQLSRSYWRIN